MSRSLCFLPATELRDLIAHRDVSVCEVVDAHLRRIEEVNPEINAIVTLTADAALEAAVRADEAVAGGLPLGPLHGLPVVHKDLHETRGVRTTYGSTLYADHVPVQDAVIVERLKAAGAITLGKSNTPEFGTGSHTYNAVFGPTRNPYDLTTSAGGSSGGSAAALAARMVPLADGTDMGGSLRNPASFCNVVGFRPSAGVVATGPSSTAWCTLAVSGPMARTVDDVGLMLSAIAGYDTRSPLSIPGDGTAFVQPHSGDVVGTRVAWCPVPIDLPVDPRVGEVLERVGRAALESLGCEISHAGPSFEGAEESFRTQRAWYYAAWFREEYDQHRDQLNADTAWNIEEGLRVTSADLIRADALRSSLYERCRRFFETYDILAMPVSPIPPFAVERRWPDEINGIRQDTYLDWMRCAYYISAAGLPAISVPCGFTSDGLPVGLQLVGPPGGDVRLLEFARAFEAVTLTGLVAPGDVRTTRNDSLNVTSEEGALRG